VPHHPNSERVVPSGEARLLERNGIPPVVER